MRVIRLMPLLVLLLAGCSDDRASYEISNEQSLTAIVRQTTFWSDVELYVVVRSEPQCQREFFLQTLPERKKAFDVYWYEGASYAFLADGQKYLFDVEKCEVTRYRDIPDLVEGDKRGRFVWRKDEGFGFAPLAAGSGSGPEQ